MKMRLIAGFAACGLMGAWQLPAGAADDPVLGSNLTGLLEYARGHNPEFAAMRYEADAAAQRVQPAAALPDPVFRTELMDITNRDMDKSPGLFPSQVGSTRYTLMQSVPWFGKRDLKRGAAEAGAEQAQGRTAATWAELAMQIKSAYARYYFVAGNQKITRDLLDLVVQMRASEIVAEAGAHLNACGAGAIAAAIAYAAERGALEGTLLQHVTSHEVMPVGRPTDMVGYGAVVFA